MTGSQAAISAACAYEITAIATGKMPTITSICRRYRAAEIAFFLWLVVHLHRDAELEAKFGDYLAAALGRRTRYGDG